MGFTVDPGVTSTLSTGGTTPTTPLVPAGTRLLTAAVNVANVNYDNEYVWGSAILSHSENDLLRPVIFNPTVIVPDAPVVTSFVNGVLKWTDPTPAATAATGSLISTLATNDPKNEFGFSVERATYALAASGPFAGKFVLGSFAQIGTVPANVTSFKDPLWVANEFYSYKVIANNAAGSTTSMDWQSVPLPPTGLTATVPVATGIPVALKWTDNAINESFYLVEVSIDGGLTYQTLANAPGFAPQPTGKGIVNYAAAATLGFNNTYRVSAVVTDLLGTVVLASLPAQVTANLLPPAAPATPAFTAATAVNAANGAVTLNWRAITGASAYLVDITSGGTAITGSPFLVTTTSFAPALPLGSSYSITVTAQASKFSGALTTNSAPSVAFVADLSAPAAPTAPASLTTTLATLTSVRLSWVDIATTETAYLLEVSTDNGATFSPLGTVPRAGNQVAATGATVTFTTPVVAGNTYIYRVNAQTVKFGSPLTTTVSGYATSAAFTAPAAPANVVATSTANNPVTVAAAPIIVSWTQTPVANVTGFTVQRRTVTAGVAGAWGGNLPGCSVATTVLTCNNTGATKGASYQFQVTARTTVAGNLVSLPSATVVAQ
jgi:hypothetical protein